MNKINLEEIIITLQIKYNNIISYKSFQCNNKIMIKIESDDDEIPYLNCLNENKTFYVDTNPNDIIKLFENLYGY